MAVKICGVEAKSIAQKHGICAGETLIAINGHEINDILDFRFYETNTTLTLLLEGIGGTQREITLRKAQYASLGLEFETYLMISSAAAVTTAFSALLTSCRKECGKVSTLRTTTTGFLFYSAIISR